MSGGKWAIFWVGGGGWAIILDEWGWMGHCFRLVEVGGALFCVSGGVWGIILGGWI